MPQYLYVSFLEKRSGFERAMRAFACARQAIALGHFLDIAFTSCEESAEWKSTHEYKMLLHIHSDVVSHRNVRIVSNFMQHYDAIFLDVPYLTYERFCFYQKYGFCIGIDLGGTARKSIPYLIDTLPNRLGVSNIYDPAGFVDTMMPRRKTIPRHCKNILLYTPHATDDTYRFIIEACVKSNIECTIVTKLLCKDKEKNADAQSVYDHWHNATLYVRFVPFARDFAHTLHQYDLVITHFGLTAFEAHYAKVPTMLVSPSAYHIRLSKRAGFLYQYRSYIRAAKLLMRFARDGNLFQAAAHAMVDMQKMEQGLSVYDRLLTSSDKIKGWYGKQSPVNPFDVTNERMPIALWRDEEKSIFLCKKTKLMFQIPFADPVAYDNAYFFREYKAQHGRSYLEDFEAICKKADDRLDCIEHIIHKKQSIKRDTRTLRLIDLGCAYGAMLTRAEARGFISCGVDISEDACAYVKNTFGIPALCANIFHDNFNATHAAFTKKYSDYFQILDGTDIRYDVLSCWYVLEHTPHFDIAIDSITHLLKPGGIFALSVSNGISSRRCFTRFLRANPIDRFSIFSPKPLIKVLYARGFTIRAVRITGNHPSRFFPSSLHWILHPSIQYVVRALSKMLHLGDTFELYMEKRHEK